MSNKGRIAVLLGGKSAEREVSLKSGNAVLAALKRLGYDAHAFDPATRELSELSGFDRVFNMLHGKYGEDGTMQGALETLGIPYTGSGVLASALAMDKWRTKLVLHSCGISTPRFMLLDETTDFSRVVDELGLPIFVKPACEGSSIGISKVKRAEDLPAAYREAAKYDPLVLAEAFVDGMEIQVPILNGKVLPSIRIETPHEFYDYDAKYLADDTRYICPAGIDDQAQRRIDELVLRAFRVLGCEGWGRADLIVDEGGMPYFIEMNTLPGMTDHSLVPMAAKAAGMSFDLLVEKILEGAHVG